MIIFVSAVFYVQTSNGEHITKAFTSDGLFAASHGNEFAASESFRIFDLTYADFSR